MTTNTIFERIGADVAFLLRNGMTDNDADLWSSRAAESLKKFITQDKSIDLDAIENFRRNQIFINEVPGYGTSLRDMIAGSRRADRVLLRERFEVMRCEGDLALLKKYPIEMAGNPHVMEVDCYRFNKRWSNNIRYLNLTARHLGDPLNNGAMTVMDIGGGYGAYLWMMKQEFSKTHSVLVEFPEQLLLAYYFLAMSYPEAKINTLEEAYETEVIDRAFFERYDFTLVPIDCFAKIKGGAVDLITNFFSLGEMSEEWFDVYRNSDAFLGAKYIFTINRFFSMPTYGTDIDILRYRLCEYRKLFFDISPYERNFYRGKWKVLTEKVPYTSQFFEFIGQKL